MMSCMTQIYQLISRYRKSNAESSARALLLLCIIHKWSIKNNFLQSSIGIFSNEWCTLSSWACFDLEINELEEAFKTIEESGLASNLEKELEGVVDGSKIEDLSVALSSYDTTLDLSLEDEVNDEKSFSFDRRGNGSHYTPWDVANLMTQKIERFQNLKLLDPAIGTGTFLLSFLQEIPRDELQSIISNQIYGGDKDQHAVWATRLALWAVGGLESNLSSSLQKSIICRDYLSGESEEMWIKNEINSIVMNPPYVVHRVGDVNYKSFDCRGCGNIWTLFVERSLNIIRYSENAQMVGIVPATLANSVRCESIRQKIIENCNELTMMNIDVVPGYLFRQGKTESTISNSNKTRDISPRVTIFTTKGKGPLNHVKNTNFLRWHNDERDELLKTNPQSVSRDAFRSEIFPMGGKEEIKRFLKLKEQPMKIKDFICDDGDYPLFVVKTARYYISAFRSNLGRKNMMQLRFESPWIRDAIHAVLVSNLFFWYWRVVGNGFQITNKQLLDFPMPVIINNEDSELSSIGRNLMDISEEISVEKINAGKVMTNLRFDDRNHKITEIDNILIKHFGLQNTFSNDLAKFKSPLLKQPIPGEFVDRDRDLVFRIAKEFIQEAGRDVFLEELYEKIIEEDSLNEILSIHQKKIHKQRTGPREPHWRHDLRNSLSNAKSKGELINPGKEIWGLPRPIVSDFDVDDYLCWKQLVAKARVRKQGRSERKGSRRTITKPLEIEDNEGGFSVEITSSNQSEIRFTRIDNNREYVITPSLIKSRIQHLVNCGGRMDKKSFHNWTPLAVTIVHLHPKLSLDGSDVVISLD